MALAAEPQFRDMRVAVAVGWTLIYRWVGGIRRCGWTIASRPTMLTPSRWSHLVRHGLLGTSVLSTTVAAADPCGDPADRTVALVIGVAVSPHPALIGGLEGRYCATDRTELMLRLEFGGGRPRVIAGARTRPFESNDNTDNLGVEVGGAVDLEGRFGTHLALTYGTHSAYLAAQALFPLFDKPGASRPTRSTLLGGFSPWTFEGRSTNVPGRPLIHNGQLVRPNVAAVPWLRSAEARAVRDHFVSAARNEYSSVWTFLRLAAELGAVGAPAELIVAALDAADDEVRHAELCAHAAGGCELAPLTMSIAQPRFTARTPEALAMLAVESWNEGCLNEAAAAEEARLAASEAQGPSGAMLATIARDEARHAALAWSVLAWLQSTAPAITMAALADTRSPPIEAAVTRDSALACHGIPSEEMTAAARAHASSTAAVRLRALVG